jgi:hypothetical protein
VKELRAALDWEIMIVSERRRRAAALREVAAPLLGKN